MALNTDGTYTVQRGDSLSLIAQRVYGDSTRWRDIAAANNLADPNLIHPGQVLTLPGLSPGNWTGSTAPIFDGPPADRSPASVQSDAFSATERPPLRIDITEWGTFEEPGNGAPVPMTASPLMDTLRGIHPALWLSLGALVLILIRERRLGKGARTRRRTVRRRQKARAGRRRRR